MDGVITMIEIKDIEEAVAKKLISNDFSVIAQEVKEGFPKPACFIEVLPVGVEVQNQFSELVTLSVEITYIPEIETKEELIETAEKLKQIFLYSSLQIKDRFLSLNEISFDIDKSSLITYFELEFVQETVTKTEDLPKMENLHERVVKDNSGTSENTN